MDIKPLVGLTVGLAGTALALNTLKALPRVKTSKPKKGKITHFSIKPVSSKRLVKTGVETMVGLGILGAIAKA